MPLDQNTAEGKAFHLVRAFVDVRRKQKITQGDLAEFLGISAQQLSKIERGANQITLSRYLMVLDFLLMQIEPNESVPAGFAEAQQAVYGFPVDARTELLPIMKSLQLILTQMGDLILKLQ